MNNELGGRYLHGMSGHIQSPFYYVQMVFQLFALGPAVLLLFVAMLWRWKPTKSAAFLVYANYVWITLILVYSLGRTNIFWYVVPAYPILAIALAIVFERLLRMLPRHRDQPVQTAPILVVIVALYRLRMYHLKRQLNFRFQERLGSAPDQRDRETGAGEGDGGAAADAGAGARHGCEFLRCWHITSSRQIS